MLSVDRLVALAGILAFIVVTSVAARRVDPGFARWSTTGLVVGIIAARIAHVALNWSTFAEYPWRAVAVWQGGFFWPAGVLAALILLLVQVRHTHGRIAGIAGVAVGLFVWNAASLLTSGVDPVPLPGNPLQTLAGEAVSLPELAGRPMVINLWATWCPPCRREMPMMANVAASSSDVTFVFANQGEDASRIRRYLSQENLLLPNVLIDGLGELGRHYSAPGLPATLFVGEDGRLVDIQLGEVSREALLQKLDDL
ncbi:TlpA disulfide reductase family protein [Aliihoeflea sp. 40Bstr573]|uniref:TlpA disulfide reductase family protein n=1 Tax=Aliihoeflea sp. 40Bstr573 TaxID=2696467 RepID=UPI0020948B50|nr:TlpA disulfide reductase family protein [Aliihoeflea sp. 40Bstr573]MCO6388516.1 redoxin family protein [Aliihoeflea sp. 40Bstr573]